MKRYNLKLFRMKQGLTQAEMATKLGLSVSHYRSIERGANEPTFKTMQKFGELFKGEYGDLWEVFEAE